MRFVFLPLGVALVCLAALADDHAESNATGIYPFGTCEQTDSGAPGSVSLPVFADGVLVAIDPDTGQFVPASPEQAARLSAAVPRNTRPDPRHEPVRHADGTLSLVLDGSYSHFSVVELVEIDGERRLIGECLMPGRFDFERLDTTRPSARREGSVAGDR